LNNASSIPVGASTVPPPAGGRGTHPDRVDSNTRPQRVEPCTCDPVVPYQCMRGFVAADTYPPTN
jgi:hypothetical protein